MGEPAEPVSLGTWPTPLEPMPRLAAELGLGAGDLLVKRDDLCGLGGGGNKVRKLEWTVADALRRGADTLVTTGAPQSNHARLTAAAAARLGLRAVLVFPGQAPSSAAGNLVLDALFGAEIVYTGAASAAGLGEAAADVASQLAAEGRVPYLIPFGGSSALAARGYVTAGREMLAAVPGVRTVVVALGSGGTMAGLVASLGAARVLGVHTGAVDDPRAVVHSLTASLDGAVRADDLRIDLNQVGAGYDALTDPVREALTLAARLEGIVLDPVYTGRALAGLIAAVRAGEIRAGESTVFLHTGGLPGLFGHADAVAFAARAGEPRRERHLR
jgi:L-cysteate sulfo-lyase